MAMKRAIAGPQVVILCGGLATRLGNLAHRTPKSMIHVGGQPFLHLQFEALLRQGFSRFLYCTGHLGDQIESELRSLEAIASRLTTKADIRFSREPATMGTLGALTLARSRNLLEQCFLIHYGDSFLEHGLESFLDSKHEECKNPKCSLPHGTTQKIPRITMSLNRAEKMDGNVDIQNGKLIYVKRGHSPYVDYGATLIDQAAMDLIPKSYSKTNLSDFFEEIGPETCFNGRVVATPFQEIGTPEGLEKLKQYLNLKEKVSEHAQGPHHFGSRWSDQSRESFKSR